MKKVITITFDEVNKIFEFLNDCVDYYERLFNNPETRTLFLANGESFKFEISKFNVAHMLGVNTNYLLSSGAYSSKNSYDVFKEMLEKGPRNFYTKLEYGNLNIEQVFSSNLFEKLSAFKKNISFNIFDSPLVCKIIQNRNHMLGKDYEDITHIMVQDTQIGYCVLEIKVDNGKAVAISSRLYDTEEEFKKFCLSKMEGQNLTFATCMRRKNLYDEITFYNLYNPEKIKRLSNLKSLSKNLNATVDVAGDYAFCLDKYGSNYEKNRTIESTNEQQLYDKSVLLQKELDKLKEMYNQLEIAYRSTKNDRDRLLEENLEYLNDIKTIDAITRKRINKSVE